MILGMHATKLVVRDVEAAQVFYQAIGLKLVSRNLGGEKEVRQKQAWLSATGDSTSHILILSQFLECPAPLPTAYPHEIWLAMNVTDVDAVAALTVQAGGSILRPGEDRPEHSVRAAVVADNEGHVIEVVGPMSTAAGPVADPLAAGQASPIE